MYGDEITGKIGYRVKLSLVEQGLAWLRWSVNRCIGQVLCD